MNINIPKVFPAISNYKSLKIFLKSSLKTCIIMDFQLVELEDIIVDLKSHEKIVFIHIDLIKGLSSDEFGAIYAIQKLKVDGIISTKSSVISICNKRNIVSIQRVFLKDSSSLEHSLQLISKTCPDYLEILPAVTTGILDEIIKRTSSKVICGGLIRTKQDIKSCLSHGAVSVTTSNIELWNI